MSSLAIGVLASGTGTNFDAIAEAIANGGLDAEIKVLVCNRLDAAVLGKARGRGIATELIEAKSFASRDEFDARVADVLDSKGVELVVMAGFDRVVTASLLERFPQRIINVHPALLPAFKGLDAQQQAADYGVTVAGATVHIVDEHVDHGPILVQAAVPVVPGESAEALRQRILEQEHRIYPFALRLFAEGRVQIIGRQVRIAGINASADACLISPPLDS